MVNCSFVLYFVISDYITVIKDAYITVLLVIKPNTHPYKYYTVP